MTTVAANFDHFCLTSNGRICYHPKGDAMKAGAMERDYLR